MNTIYNVHDDNFLLLAIKYYDKPIAIMSEFEDDLKRIKYVKRLIKRYQVTGDLKERLILNHIIVLANCFGTDFTVKTLFYKLDSSYYPILKPFLVFLNYMPDSIHYIRGKVIHSSDIIMDNKVIELLRTI